VARRRPLRKRAEIIEDIVSHLGRLRAPEKDVQQGVVESLEWFAKHSELLRQPSWAKRKRVARKLEGALTTLLTLLDKHAKDRLLEMCWPADGGELRSLLLRIRGKCASLRATRVPRPVKDDLLKYWSAKHAYGVIAKFAKNPPTTTDAGPLQIIASLYYEAIEGTPAVHLKRFCDTAVKEDKSITKTLSIIEEIKDIGVGTPGKIAQELNRRGIGWPAGKWSPRKFEWNDFLVGKMEELAVKRQDFNLAPVDRKPRVRVR
jgi:hypothetical protein